MVPQGKLDQLRNQIKELAQEIQDLQRQEAEESLTPEQRRARFRVIKGGLAGVATPFVWAWHQVRDHQFAAAALGAAGALSGAALVVPPAEPESGTDPPEPVSTLTPATPSAATTRPPPAAATAATSRASAPGAPGSVPGPAQPPAVVPPDPVGGLPPLLTQPPLPSQLPLPSPLPTVPLPSVPPPGDLITTVAEATEYCLEVLLVSPLELAFCIDEVLEPGPP